MTVATLLMAERTGAVWLNGLSYVLLALLVLVVAGLCVRTVVAIWRGEICVPE